MTIAQNYPTTRPSLLLDFSNQTVLDPRVTFTRTTTGYYYDNHSAALAEQNLLTYSNTFSNAAWNKGNITAVQGATDPTGGSLGWTFTATATINYHSIYYAVAPSLAAGTYVYSVYLQAGVGAGSTTYATVAPGSNNVSQYVSVTFDLSGAGAVTQTLTAGPFSVVSSSIVQVGSTAWYRCSVVFSVSSSFQFQGLDAALSNSATFTPTTFGVNSFSAAGTETLLVYGAQLEQHSSPTVYTATTASAITTYTPTLQVAASNSPRFDYNPITRESLGLLLEQAATNVMLYSTDYTQANWTKNNVTITPTASVSPDGTQNASLMVLGLTSVSHNTVQTFTYTAATYTQSVYIKFYGQQFVQLYTNANGGASFCNFDILNGTAGTPSGGGSPVASIQSVGNGWYRCSLTLTAIASSAGFYIAGSTSISASGLPSFVGNGFNGYLIWGAQVEALPSATSYIATTLSAQTRTQDLAFMSGTNFTSWYQGNQGSVYVDGQAGGSASNNANCYMFGFSNSTLSALGLQPNYYTNCRLQCTGFSDITQPMNIAPLSNKFSISFSPSTLAISTNGATISSYTGFAPSTPYTALYIGGRSDYPGTTLNGRIKKFAYYPIVLTSTQLQSLSAN